MDGFDQAHAVVTLVAIVTVSVCVLIHYESLAWLSQVLPRMQMQRRPRVLLLIFAILTVHSVEILLFAFGYFLLLQDPAFGALAGLGDLTLVNCGYFSAVVFTTLGLGDIIPHGPVRLLAGPEALAGFVLITWSASFTFIEMQSFWKRAA
ncbi:MAG: ion channel [Steroidobacteraceae bacterium]